MALPVDEFNAYGRPKAERQGFREEDVDRLVHEARAGGRQRSNAAGSRENSLRRSGVVWSVGILRLRMLRW